MQFSVTMQLNTTFTDLSVLADFSAKLRDVLASFAGNVVPAAPAPVALPATPVGTSPPEVIVPPSGTEPRPRTEKGRRKDAAPVVTADAPALPLEATTAPASEPVKPADAPAATVATPAPSPAASEPVKPEATTYPQKTVDDCKTLILRRWVPAAGPAGAPKLMELFKAFGASSIAGVPADKCGEFFARLEALTIEAEAAKKA